MSQVWKPAFTCTFYWSRPATTAFLWKPCPVACGSTKSRGQRDDCARKSI